MVGPSDKSPSLPPPPEHHQARTCCAGALTTSISINMSFSSMMSPSLIGSQRVLFLVFAVVSIDSDMGIEEAMVPIGAPADSVLFIVQPTSQPASQQLYHPSAPVIGFRQIAPQNQNPLQSLSEQDPRARWHQLYPDSLPPKIF